MGYRILIADDEIKIIQLIQELGHWEELGIQIVAICNDGEDALIRIMELKPDIVLTDIKMPIYDGIQLIEKTKERGLDTHFIVISGYKYFEYARSAISLGVVDYLLKPLDEVQLNRTLEKTCKMITEKEQRRAGEEQLEKYLQLDKTKAHEQLLEALLNDRGSVVTFTNEQECNVRYQTAFRPGLYRCIYVTTDVDSLLSGQESLFSEKMTDIFETIFCARFRYASCFQKRGTLLILNYDSGQQDEVKQAVTALYYSIKNLTEIYGDFMLNIGVSMEKRSILSLQEALQEAFIAEFGRLVLLGDKVLEYDVIKGLPRFNSRDLLSTQRELDLVGYVKFFQFEQIGVIFSSLYKESAGYTNFYPGDMRSMLQYLETQVLGIHIGEVSSAEFQEAKYELDIAYKKARNFQQMFRQLYLFLEKWLRIRLEALEEQKGKPVEEARKYIAQHYAEPLSLEMLAERSQLTPTYFSRLFKLETSIGFSDYVIQIRMEKAKEFLLESNDSIKSVAGRVGYQDDKYFSKLFKKQVGIKPSEFRRVYAR